jgi:hypothetical protein
MYLHTCKQVIIIKFLVKLQQNFWNEIREVMRKYVVQVWQSFKIFCVFILEKKSEKRYIENDIDTLNSISKRLKEF